MTANTIITSVVTGGSNNHATVSEEANAYATDWVSQGVVGTITNTSGVSPSTGSFAVNADGTPDLGVTISLGVGYIIGTPTAQGSQVLRARATTNYTNYVINANASGSTKYDWIYLQLSATNAANPSAAADNVASFLTSRSSSNVTDNGTPPTYGTLLAVVTVINGAATIANTDVSDRRTQSALSIPSSPATTGWGNGLGSITAVTNNGNGSYTLTTSTDNRAIMNSGYKFRTTRSVVAPTQSTSLNGSTQYFSKATPNKSSFTNNFVAFAAVKPATYALGTMISIYNGTSGWALRQLATGQVELSCYNAGAANFFKFTSNNSVFLNRWHNNVAIQVDMTVTTNTPTTNYIMINGIDVPGVATRGGTNPTALVQAGNLNVGAENGGTNPYSGKIAQAGWFTAKVTQATLLGYMSQSLLGTETSLGSAYSFNNALTDLNTTTPNDLTAQGAAVATNADSPFGGQVDGTISTTLDYGFVHAISSTTITVQVPEGCTIPTTGGVASFSYSNAATPIGFPKQEDKWLIRLDVLTTVSSSGTSTTTIYNPGGLNIVAPIGPWLAKTQYNVAFTTNAGGIDISSTLSTSSTVAVNSMAEFSSRNLVGIASSAPQVIEQIRTGNINVTVATPLFLLVESNAAITALAFKGSLGTLLNESTTVTLKNAYL